MNKESALQELRTIEARLAELRKIIEQPEEVGLWEPAKERLYSYVTMTGHAEAMSRNHDIDEQFISHGNCFQTESIARKASQLQRVHNHVMRACFQADPDAGEWIKRIRTHVIHKGYKGDWIHSEVSYPTNGVCVHTESQATEACRLLNAWQAKEDAK